jgi:carbon starvation protein CstA
MMTYYSTLTAMGVDYFPTNNTELFTFLFVNIVGALVYGLIIGNFSEMLEKITRKERL